MNLAFARALLLALSACSGANAARSQGPTEQARSLQPQTEVVPAEKATAPGADLTPAPPPEAPAPQALQSNLPRPYTDLSQRVVYAWVRDGEARALAPTGAPLLREPQYGKGPDFTVFDERDERELRLSDGWTKLVFRSGFAQQRLVWPSLSGAVLQRDQGAFVPVRIELEPTTVVIDLEQRRALSLDGALISQEEVRAHPEHIGLVFFRAGHLRAYSLVNASAVAQLEVGSERIAAAFEQELASLQILAQRETDVPDEMMAQIEITRMAFAEAAPNVLDERIKALTALSQHEVAAWERGAPGRPFALGQAVRPRQTSCIKQRFAGRKLAPDEWCGTGAMSFDYCSPGCQLGDGRCQPLAKSW